MSTGAAVALCSWTTIVGYGSLLAARNQALQGFGAMAILGEVACLLAAIMALPAALLWWQARARPQGTGSRAQDGQPELERRRRSRRIRKIPISTQTTPKIR